MYREKTGKTGSGYANKTDSISSSKAPSTSPSHALSFVLFTPEFNQQKKKSGAWLL
jgi:hypothetical protein